MFFDDILKCCNDCGEYKDISEYYTYYDNRDKKVRVQARCKVCAKKRATDFKRKNSFGMKPEVYEKKVLEQEGKCAICKSKYPERDTKALSVDHNHETNVCRDLLCHSCNSMIGFAREDIEILEAAILYLKKHG